MDLLLVLIAVCGVLLAVRLVRARQRGRPVPDPAWTPDDPTGRGPGTEPRPADARRAANRHSWMLGGGGSGG